MSQHAVEQTLGRLLTDAEFCRRFFEDPGPTSVLSGLKLSPEELEALRRLPRADLAMLSRRLDDRICRLCASEESVPRYTARSERKG
jgi:hypothetical protein